MPATLTTPTTRRAAAARLARELRRRREEALDRLAGLFRGTFQGTRRCRWWRTTAGDAIESTEYQIHRLTRALAWLETRYNLPIR